MLKIDITIIPDQRDIRKSCGAVLALLLLIAATPGYAGDYKVEVLVFENLQPHTAYESYRQTPIEPIATEASAWQQMPEMLLDHAETLVESEKYRLVHHFSWGQESLPVSEAAVVNLIEQEVSGWIKVYARHLLFVNLELDFNGYRMSEKRRIKLNEQHFFDHPKFGVLMQVSRLELPEPEEIGESSAAVDSTEQDPALLLPPGAITDEDGNKIPFGHYVDPLETDLDLEQNR